MRNLVRDLEFRDQGAALHLALLFHQESWQRDYHFDPAKVSRLIEDFMISPSMKCFILADGNDRPVGYIAGVAAEMHFGRDRNVNDLGLYIMPEYRNARDARGLVAALEQWAWAQPGVKEISLGISAGIEQQAIVRFYERLGYTKGFYGVSKKSR